MPAEHFGREQEIAALGKRWRLARFDRSVWTKYLEWAKTVIPSPFDVIRPALTDPAYTVEQRNQLVEIAGQKAMNQLQEISRDVAALLNRLDGLGYLFFLLLQSNHPEIDLDTAFAIVCELGMEGARKLRQKAEGKTPPADGSFPGPAEHIDPNQLVED